MSQSLAEPVYIDSDQTPIEAFAVNPTLSVIVLAIFSSLHSPTFARLLRGRREYLAQVLYLALPNRFITNARNEVGFCVTEAFIMGNFYDILNELERFSPVHTQ